MCDKRLERNHHQSVSWKGITAALSLLCVTHVTFWSVRGMKVARKWQIFAWTLSFFAFFLVTAVISGSHNGVSKVAGQGLTGRLGVRLPIPLSGVWLPNERLPLLDEPVFHEPSPEIKNRGLVDNLWTINSILMIWLWSHFMSNYFGHYVESKKSKN